MKSIFRKALLAGLSCLALAAGDLTITYKTTTTGMGGGEGTETQYMNASKMRQNMSGAHHNDSLIDFDTQTIYVIEHDKKVIKKATFQELSDAMAQLDAQMDGQMGAMMASMFGDMSEVKVTQLGKDTVLGRSCNKVRLQVGKINQEMSLDPSLKPPMDMAKAMKMSSIVPGPMGAGMRKMYEKMRELKGFPLKSHMTGMMGMDSLREATSISESAIPASAWALPAGYATKSLTEDMHMGARRH
ncbi:MAG TPA: DUF4412 domain-containing protein [Holophagaceae bacterium]|nr:DUF4412 domain-containing protein [Holophagaceae bacterium]